MLNTTKNSISKNIFQDWIKKYSLSKTLRFELKPDPETKPFLEEIVGSDTQRDKDYNKLKKIIDEYHKIFIERSLSTLSAKTQLCKKNYILDLKDLTKAKELSSELKKFNQDFKTKQNKQKELKVIQDSLRKSITAQFGKLSKELKKKPEAIKKSKKTKNKSETETNSVEDTEKQAKTSKSPLFERELITVLLPDWLKKLSYQETQDKPGIQEQIKVYIEEKGSVDSKSISNQKTKKFVIDEQAFLSWKKDSLNVVAKFNQFTTYLNGFHENRKNIYSDKEQTTAVAHRIIHENLPKFFSNINIYQQITKNAPDLQKELNTLSYYLKDEFDYFGIKNIAGFFELNIFNKSY